jgi:succinoglycan biosynthesis transport protein ExoP
VKPPSLTVRDIMAIYRRRKKYLFIPAAIITVFSVLGAIIISSKYESSTTILVQRQEILNPLISYEMAVTMASEDRLRTFNEILFSHTTMKKLYDSLYRKDNDGEVKDETTVLEALKSNITVEKRGSDSFRIIYVSSDPIRAQAAVQLLADDFIQTTLRVEGQQNEQAVKFFQDKLNELKDKVEASQGRVVSTLKTRINELPQDSRNLSLQLDTIEKELADYQTRINLYQEKLVDLQMFPQALGTEPGMQTLYELARSPIPFADELKLQLQKYDDITRKYKGNYPEVTRVQGQLTDLLVRIQKALETEIKKQEPTRQDLEQKRQQLIENLRESSVSQKIDQDDEADYSVYKKLYDEMKVKLEQAVMARDLGRTSSNQFIILDPPLVPTQPTKPNRPLLVVGGLFLGILFGCVSVIVKEVMDTTIRSARDIEVYQKPVIAFIGDGTDERLN